MSRDSPAKNVDPSVWWVPMLFLACYFWMLLAMLQPIQDADLWWHLASGRDILQHHRVPSVDVFSLTASGTRWINSYWLYDSSLSMSSMRFLGASGVLFFMPFWSLGFSMRSISVSRKITCIGCRVSARWPRFFMEPLRQAAIGGRKPAW